MEYNPKIAKACPFPYYWRAKFADGEVVSQYTNKGKEVLYREVLSRIEQGKALSYIELLPTYADGFVTKDRPIYRQEIDSAWQRPIVFHRHFINQGPRGEIRHVIMALGWQATIHGQNYKSILYIDIQNGQVLITHRDW